jgi:hypothetical protein
VKPRSYLAALCAALAVALAVSCGDVPTLAGGVAFITPIQLPSPAVEADSSLHDSTGAVAPLRVQAFDRSGNVIPGVPVTYVVLTLPPRLTIAPDGTVTAKDTVLSPPAVQIVARVGDRLQTPTATLPIVPHPAALARGGLDTAVTLPAIKPLPVTVTGTWHGTTLPVFGVIVRYAISAIYPSSAAGSAVLTNTAGMRLRDSTTAVDTTDASGNATHSNLAVSVGVDSVVVLGRALDFNGKALPGSPQTFVLRARKP